MAFTSIFIAKNKSLHLLFSSRIALAPLISILFPKDGTIDLLRKCE